MKIKTLTMQAFLTYKEKVSIDFETMIDQGIYLISGSTGSGKTSIFDAITFALYGVASGERRQQSYLRSDFADAKEETYVELIFLLRNKEYTVKRSPTYTREGYKTPKNANAFLTYDNQTIEGVREVNAKITEILGVDVNQFKQIVMIAQGEFTRLIYATSEEREKVLRHIFHSEPLVLFQEELKTQMNQYKNDYSLSVQSLLTQFSTLHLSEDFLESHKEFHPQYIEEAYFENEAIKEDALKKEEFYNQAKKDFDDFSNTFYTLKQANEDIERYELLNSKYNTLLSQEDHMLLLKKDLEKLEEVQNNQNLLIQYKQTKQNLKKYKTLYTELLENEKSLVLQNEEAQKNYQEVSHLSTLKEKLLIQEKQLNDTLKKQDAYKEMISYVYKIQKQKQDETLKKQTLEEENQKLTNRLERDRESVSHLELFKHQLEESEKLVKELNQRRVSIHELGELYDSYVQRQEEHFGLSNQYQKSLELYKEKQALYLQEEEKYKFEQAGIIALSLKENEPCPVCGSIEHPAPASIKEAIYSEEELLKLKKEVKRLEEEKEGLYLQLTTAHQEVSNVQLRVSFLKKQLGVEEDLSKEIFIKLLGEMTLIINEQQSSYNRKKDEVTYLSRLKKTVLQDEIILKNKEQELEQTSTSIHTIDKDILKYESKLEEMVETTPLIQDDDVSKQLQTLKDQLIDISQKITSYTDIYHKTKESLSLLISQKDDLTKTIEDTKTDYALFEKEYNDFIGHFFKDEEEFLEYQEKMKYFRSLEKEYKDYTIEKQTIFNQKEELKLRVQGKKKEDLSLKQEKMKEMESLKDHLFKEWNQSIHIYEDNQKMIQSIKMEYKKNQDVLENYTVYQDLYDMAAGKNAFKMSFERYVLSFYFEHILKFANVELLKMSQGRFELYRKKETQGARQQGLDLSVLDYETGMLRDIQTLSGGESFKAALSLALGLSSMIQSYAGGIELNTLFIDEGFGSLDNESLDQALNVLLDLKNDDKVIGIISHVGELKERIATKVIVEKGTEGSNIHIEKD